MLIVMYDAGSEQELLSACTEASDAALEAGAIDVYIADTPERIASVWSVRGAILEGMKAESVAQEECDVVVPRAKIAEYVRLAKGIGAKYGIRVEPCGHAGDGNIHTEMLRDASMSDEDWIKGTRACLTELYGVSKQVRRPAVRRTRNRKRTTGILKAVWSATGCISCISPSSWRLMRS